MTILMVNIFQWSSFSPKAQCMFISMFKNRIRNEKQIMIFFPIKIMKKETFIIETLKRYQFIFLGINMFMCLCFVQHWLLLQALNEKAPLDLLRVVLASNLDIHWCVGRVILYAYIKDIAIISTLLKDVLWRKSESA